MRLTKNKFIHIIVSLCVGLTLTAGSALSVYAADNSITDESVSAASDESTASDSSSGKPLLPVEDLSQETSMLTVNLVYVDEALEQDVPVEGAVIDLYKVADLVTENGAAYYNLTEAFASSGLDFEGMTASESLEAAEILNQMIDTNSISITVTGTTNEHGYLVFSDLTPGMYLGRQREFVRISETKKITMEPVLWMTPMYILNETQDAYVWDYEPEVLPKEGEIERIPTVTPTITVTPTVTVTPTATVTPAATVTPKSMITNAPPKTTTTTTGTARVKTGDNSPIGVLVVIAIMAIVVIVLVLKKRK